MRKWELKDKRERGEENVKMKARKNDVERRERLEERKEVERKSDNGLKGTRERGKNGRQVIRVLWGCKREEKGEKLEKRNGRKEGRWNRREREKM